MRVLANVGLQAAGAKKVGWYHVVIKQLESFHQVSDRLAAAHLLLVIELVFAFALLEVGLALRTLKAHGVGVDLGVQLLFHPSKLALVTSVCHACVLVALADAFFEELAKAVEPSLQDELDVHVDVVNASLRARRLHVICLDVELGACISLKLLKLHLYHT